MNYQFSLHSLEQIKLRDLSKEIVGVVIQQPDDVIFEPDNQMVYQKVIENYLYRVFVNNEKTPC
ncbi:MAG: hypothetical protein RLZZ312_1018 [Bacteroidota bacterium]|jgi:hypothetical protein